MLPTKGYFQDIECPFYNTTCGRPYCHFRHRRKANEIVIESVEKSSENVVPTYKPTPKSELAKNHIPISYVPDLAYKRDRSARPIRTEKPTYKPTPLSILSSVNNPENENHEHRDTIKDIQENIASNVYDPFKSEINFEELSGEFDLIDGIINESAEEGPEEEINDNIDQINSDIEKTQNKLNLLKSEIKSKDDNKETVKVEGNGDIKKEKSHKDKSSRSKSSDDKDNKKEKAEVKSNDKSKHKSSKVEKDLKKTSSKSHKSSEREKHRKEEKKNSSDKHKITKSKERSKSPKEKKNDRKQSRDRSKSPKEKKSDKKQSRDRSKSPKEKKSDKKRSRDRSKSPKEKKPSRDRSKSPKAKKNDKKESHDSNSSHSSPERHRKKTDSLESKKSSSKGKSTSSSKKEKSRSPSREKHSKTKSKKRSRSRSKDSDRKHTKTKKEKSKSKDKDKSSSTKKSDKEKRKKSTSESNHNMSDHDDEPAPAEEIIPSDVDLDYEDEDETMRECFKIFNEYKPEAMEPQIKNEHKDLFEEEPNSIQSRKRKAHAGAESSQIYSKPTVAPPKPSLLPGQILKNRYKIAKLAQANNEQENIMNEVKTIIAPKPKSLLEAARQYKIKRLEHQKALEQNKPKPNNVVDDILNGTHRPSASGIKPKKIAAVPNVALIEKAKQRISLVKQRIENVKTIAQTQKTGRVAHVPEYSLSDIPDVLQADKSKLPVNVRTRFLTMLADECAKIYASKEDIYNRALNEEFACYEKCKVLATYRNSTMLAVNRLRKEHQDRESKGLGLLLSGEAALSKKETDFEGITFYNHVKKWLLTEEDLDLHGYPKESHEKGRAIIQNRATVEDYSIDENQRRCSRCGKIYQVDDDGWPLFEDECMYHPLKKRTIRREQVFLCCKSSDDTGCVMSDTHVFDGLEKYLLEGYQTTMPPTSDNDSRSTQVYALDCEMCYTTKGLELTRVTIVDVDCKTVYESFVKPLNPIIDYNTRFSGITKDQMDRTSTSILQVQANILHLCNSETILVGHSLESDMKALKIVHGTIIDTSILFPHKMGLPHKRSLKALASEHLQKIIQNDVAGHDSAEDAVSCMELIKWKLKEELKVKTKGR